MLVFKLKAFDSIVSYFRHTLIIILRLDFYFEKRFICRSSRCGQTDVKIPTQTATLAF